jgi:hypothetical protein
MIEQITICDQCGKKIPDGYSRRVGSIEFKVEDMRFDGRLLKTCEARLLFAGPAGYMNLRIDNWAFCGRACFQKWIRKQFK